MILDKLAKEIHVLSVAYTLEVHKVMGQYVLNVVEKDTGRHVQTLFTGSENKLKQFIMDLKTARIRR